MARPLGDIVHFGRRGWSGTGVCSQETVGRTGEPIWVPLPPCDLQRKATLLDPFVICFGRAEGSRCSRLGA